MGRTSYGCPSNHFHYFQIFLIVVFAYLTKGDVHKCCPNGSYIKIRQDSTYECERELIRSQIEFDAYNINHVNQLPPNCAYIVRKLTESVEKLSELNGCVDRSSNGDLYAISCANEPIVYAHHLNRCCPFGHSYDHLGRYCVPISGSQSSFQQFFGDSVILFKTHVPDCEPEEVFVEYVTTEHEIHFDGNMLSVNNEILQPNKFCVEELMGAVSNELDQKHLIVRSCRPQSLCNKIPCVRRCCKTDQMIVRPGICKPHPEQKNFLPILYDIDFPLQENKSQPKAYIKGMSIRFEFSKILCVNNNRKLEIDSSIAD